MRNTIQFIDEQTLQAYLDQLVKLELVLKIANDNERLEPFKDDVEKALPFLKSLNDKINLARLSEETISE